MSYSKYYNPTNWENYPSEDTAINAMHLNNLEDGVDTLDDRIVALSTDKSEVSWNQTLISGEKIAEITVNGITKNVYAPEISDSVVEQAAEQALKSEGYAVGTQGDVPVTSGLYYHNNSKYYSEQASDSASDASASAVEAGQSADDAEEEALVSEGWANGEQNGVPVEQGSPYYHNNSKYWSQQSSPINKADISAIGTNENGRTTASRSYAQGEHFYKDGKFCTAKTAIASGATFTLNTNYEESTIADTFKSYLPKTVEITANSSQTINLAERSFYMMYSYQPYIGGKGMYGISTWGSSVINVQTISADSALTITTGNGQITVASTAARFITLVMIATNL